MSEYDTEFGERLKLAVQKAGGLKAVSRELGRGESTFYTYFNGQSSPSVADANRICSMAKIRSAWLFSGEEPMSRDHERSLPRLATDAADVVDVPVLPMAASAGPGTHIEDGKGDEESIPIPAKWLRQFGTPSRLKVVEIVGGSMTPPLEDGDWVLINLDKRDLRDGIAVVRYNDTMLIKRLQLQGRTKLVLTSSAAGYEPIPIDTVKEGENFDVIGYAEGRWRPRGLA